MCFEKKGCLKKVLFKKTQKNEKSVYRFVQRCVSTCCPVRSRCAKELFFNMLFNMLFKKNKKDAL